MDELAGELVRRFVSRKDVKAWQHSNGAYTPDRTPLTRGDTRAHLNGERTLGHYVVNPENNEVKFFCFDIDLEKTGHWKDFDDIVHEINPRAAYLQKDHPARPQLIIELRCIAEALARRCHSLGLEIAVVDSGCKGLHVYAFDVLRADQAREMAKAVLNTFDAFKPARGSNFFRYAGEAYRNLTIELFPKQDSMADKDLGNLIRLPLGINQKTRRRTFFVEFPPAGGWAEMNAQRALNGEVPWHE